MSFQNFSIEGELSSEQTKTIVKVDENDEVISETEVQESKGEFQKVTFECEGERVTLKGLITSVQRNLGVKAVAAFEVQEPGKPTYQVNSLDSEKVTKDGEDVEVPADTKVTPVLSGKAF